MEFKEKRFEVSLLGNCLHFKGSIECTDYFDLTLFLQKVDLSLGDNELVMDFRELDFLNSSGIQMFVLFLYQTKRKVIIRINPKITWQRAGVIPLSNIKPNKMISIETGERVNDGTNKV